MDILTPFLISLGIIILDIAVILINMASISRDITEFIELIFERRNLHPVVKADEKFKHKMSTYIVSIGISIVLIIIFMVKLIERL